MAELKRIGTKAELLQLARELGVGNDWHEPDSQDVDARVYGETFDNAGFWGVEFLAWRRGQAEGDGRSIRTPLRLSPQSDEEFYADVARRRGYEELHVVLRRGGTPVAEVNLATLFAWATGWED